MILFDPRWLYKLINYFISKYYNELRNENRMFFTTGRTPNNIIFIYKAAIPIADYNERMSS